MKSLYLWIAVSFEIIADYYFKIWSTGDRFFHLCMGVFLYAVGTVFFAFALKDESLAKTVGLFTVANCVAACLIGLWFGEKFDQKMIVGIILGLISIWLLE
jgi:multidrug transporter EmrE-like cation transporter